VTRSSQDRLSVVDSTRWLRYVDRVREAPDIALVTVDGGALALTHRPKLKSLAGLGALGVTHVVTLLSEREGAQQIGDAARAAGLTWIWAPLEGGDVPSAAKTVELRAVLDQLAAAIGGGGRVVVHCSAGIHRTGMFGYALLRRLGLPANEARRVLAELRAVTADGVGADRLAWGDALAATAE
jgi:protein-tyrosine phosphatase